MLDMVKKYDGQPVTEVHIVGGVHRNELEFFAELLRKNKRTSSRINIKGLRL
jgi:aminodeoxyfutalosine synthase